MTRTLKRLALAGLFLLPMSATRLAAQTPTPEGTVITNTAQATFTDANGNAYPTVSASSAVTVGFLAGPNPTAAAATATPGTGTTGNTMTFTLGNNGNGTDNFVIGEPAHAGVTVTSYSYNGTSYASLSALNTALALSGNALTRAGTAGSSGTLVLTYSVAAGTGGTSIPVSITQTSVRTSSATASATTTVNPPAARSVSVTPDAATQSLMPRGTVYSQIFTITNSGNASDSYDFTVGVSSGMTGSVTISTVDGAAATTGTTATLAAGSAASVVVTYFVNNTVGSAPAVTVPAGTTASITLTAKSTALGTITDGGDLTVTVVRAAVTMTKVAYLDDLSAPVGASLVLPGQYLQYRITVSNASGATAVAASNIAVSDALPAEVTYDSVSGDLPGWTFTGTTTVTANLSGTLAAGASRFFYIRVRVR